MYCDQCDEAALQASSGYCHNCGAALARTETTAASVRKVPGDSDGTKCRMNARSMNFYWGAMLIERGFNRSSEPEQIETLLAHFYNMGGIDHDEYADIMAFALERDKFEALKHEMFPSNNIFKYATKELSTDAFLAWLFIELETNQELRPRLAEVFVSLGLIEAGETPANIHVKLQYKNIDLLLYFEVSGSERRILFENKVWSSLHSNQLHRYANDVMPGCDKYIYLKLGYLDVREQARVDQHKYETLTSEEVYRSLKPLSSLHPFIDHYCDFLKFNFIEKINQAIRCVKSTDLNALKGAMAQKYLAGLLYQRLKGSDDALEFKSGTNIGGRPWVQLYLCRKEKIYAEHGEILFWRIDRHGKRPYLRLSQYSRFPKDNEVLKSQKKTRLAEIRRFVNELCDASCYNRLVKGKVTNKGVFENEIVIFYFEDNPYEVIMEAIPALSRAIQDGYRSITP